MSERIETINEKPRHFAVEDFIHFLKESKEENKPYVFFTGAGCSKSANIPLAGELVKEMNEKYPRQLSLLAAEDKQRYDMCMSKLSRDERRKLLMPHMQNASINWAHIALASLLKDEWIERVLTFNFDNVLARACGLIGLYPSVYDFTNADVNLHNLIVNPAIVHLHGQSYGFTQLNTDEETKEHAKKLSNFINSTLNASPVVFVGYSGQADAFFSHLEEAYTGEHRLFWIGFERDIPQHLSCFLNKHEQAHYIGGQDADKFFIALMRTCSCIPKTFINPYEHLLNELKEVTDFPSGIETNEKTNLLIDTRKELTNSSSRFENRFERYLLEGNYLEIISEYENNKDKFSDKLGYAVIAYNNYALDNSKIAVKLEATEGDKLFKESYNHFSKAIAIAAEECATYFNWGNALVMQAETKEGLEAAGLYEEARNKFSKSLGLEPSFWEANVNYGVALLDNSKLVAKDEKKRLLTVAYNQLNRAFQINQDSTLILHALLKITYAFVNTINDSEEVEKILFETLKKYQIAIEVNNNSVKAHTCHGVINIQIAKLKNSVKKLEYMDRARADFKNALRIEPKNIFATYCLAGVYLEIYAINKDESTLKLALDTSLNLEKMDNTQVYNLGCVYANMGDFKLCKEKLLHAKSVGTLPSKKHLLEDPDLESVRNEPWFEELLS